MKLRERLQTQDQLLETLEQGIKFLRDSRGLWDTIKNVRSAISEWAQNRDVGVTFAAMLTKARFTRLYEGISGKAIANILERTSHYDRIGPILLPLELHRTGEIVEFTVFYFGFYNGQDYFVLTTKSDLKFRDPLVRVSSNCNWAFDFGSRRCECSWELEHAKERVANEQNAMIIFALDQHGKSIPGATRGHSLIYALGQAQRQDLVRSAYIDNGFDLDYRKYDDIAEILRDFGVMSLRLMTNNPERLEFFRKAGFIMVAREPIEKPYDAYDSEELGVKRELLGHMLELPKFRREDVGIYGLDADKIFGKKDL